ncbi:hypothetical protein A4A49_53322, partial [Nicotiana attenuata]
LSLVIGTTKSWFCLLLKYFLGSLEDNICEKAQVEQCHIVESLRKSLLDYCVSTTL